MKYIFFIILFLSSFAAAQAPDKITRKCPTPNTSAFASVSVINDIIYTPCPNQPSFFNGQVKLLDKSYAPFFSLPVINYLAIGTAGSSTITVPTANHFAGLDFNFPLVISGASKFYVGSHTAISVQGTATNPQVYGQWASISSNSLFPSGTGSLYGSFATVDVGGQVNEAFGGYFSAQSGGSGASGTGNIYGIRAEVGMAHNGNTTNAFGGDFYLTGTASTPSIVGTAMAVRARWTLQNGINVNELRGISLTDSNSNGGTATNSYGIYADSSIDIGTNLQYFIYSRSQSPSRLDGNLAILRTLGNANGLILQSPDGNCWKITVDNAGTLNTAGTSCP